MQGPQEHTKNSARPGATVPIFKIPKHKEVYVLESAGLCKLGISWRADQRVKQVRSNLPTPVRLIQAFSVPMPYGLDVEAEAHRQLWAHRVRGEWFAVSPRGRLCSGRRCRCPRPRAIAEAGTQEGHPMISAWQAIESAPKDGTCIIGYPVFGPPCEVAEIQWRELKRNSRWESHGLIAPRDPTHWQPLPLPPPPLEAT